MGRLVRTIQRFAALAVLLASAALPVSADPALGPIAAEILDGLRTANVSSVPAMSGYGQPTIRIRHFQKNETPVPDDIANGWNQSLLRELQRRSRDQFVFVEDNAIAALIRDIEQSDLPTDDRESRIADLRESRLADIIVTGRVSLTDGMPWLSYQAIAAHNGRVLATTEPRRMSSGRRPETVVAAADNLPPQPPAADDAGYGYRHTVEEAEALLKALGYEPGPVDGYLTEETRRALRAYQLDSALPVNGRMTQRVVENMRRDTR